MIAKIRYLATQAFKKVKHTILIRFMLVSTYNAAELSLHLVNKRTSVCLL